MQPARLEGARPVGGGAPPGQTRPARPPVRLSRRGTRTCAASFSRDESRQGPAAAARGAPSGAEQSRLARLLSRQADAAPEGAVLARPAAAGAIRRVAATVATNTADEEEQAVAEAALLLQQQQQQPGEGREVQVDAQPKQQPAQHQVEAPAAAAEQSGAFSLYSWLTWGSSGSPAAAATGSGSDAEDGVTEVEGVAQLADGMATAPSSDTIGSSSSSSSWRRWYGLGRAARGGSGSFDDGEATPQRWQQSVPVDHPALQLLRQRALAGSRPGQRRDHFKLGLVVEGGGMRGCVSGGSLQALTDLGLRECFDAVYGSSAGAINSTYFLSGQRTGVDIYHQHIACPEFINLRRLRWRGGAGAGAASGSLSSVDEEPTPVLNLSFLIDHVMDSVHPLDWDAVLASPVPLKVVASSLDSLNPVLLHSFEGRDDLAQCLKASATVPEIAGGPRLHRGHRLVDAAVFEPVPFRSAIADGCTHLLVLCTRPVPLTRRSRVNSYLSDAVEVAIKKAVLSPDYMVPAWKAELEYLSKDGLTQDDQLLKAATQPDAHELPWFAGTHVLPLYPGAAANFSPLCIDPPTLRGGVAEGRRNVLAVCRALLGDAWDFSRFPELESSNIVPTRSPSSSSARLWRRYFADDFSTHA